MQETFSQYVPFGIFLVVAAGLAVFILTVGALFRPKNPRPEKSVTYECGNDPVGEANRPILPRYFFFAMLLVIFDVEAAFLIPWALNASSLGATGLAAVGLFFAVLMAGFFYLWRKGDLRWD